MGSKNYFFEQQNFIFWAANILDIEIRNFGLFREKIFVKMNVIQNRLDFPFPKERKRRFYFTKLLKKIIKMKICKWISKIFLLEQPCPDLVTSEANFMKNF